MSEEYRRFDPADYVKSEEDVRGLLRAAADEDNGDGAVIRAVLKRAARTRNMSALARDTGLNRGNLYEALSEDGNPTLATLLKVANALGLRLRLESVEDRAEPAAAPKRGGRTLEEILADLSKNVPAEDWAKLPDDLIDNLDHYTAGADRVDG